MLIETEAELHGHHDDDSATQLVSARHGTKVSGAELCKVAISLMNTCRAVIKDMFTFGSSPI